MANYVTSAGLETVVSKLKGLMDSAHKAVNDTLTAASDNLTEQITTKSGEVTSALNDAVNELTETLNAGLDTKVAVDETKDLVLVSEAEKLAKITVDENGVISADNIPTLAFERCVTVKTVEAMYALTKDQVQNGDSVRLEVDGQTPIMYYVVDDNNLDSEAGYHVYASITDWARVENIPARITTPATLEIQVNGVKIAEYNGHEMDTVEADVKPGDLGLAIVDDTEIDEIFGRVFAEPAEDPVA